MKKRKLLLIFLICLSASAVIGLAVTGWQIGWGPFSFLHNFDREAEAIKNRYDVSSHQQEIIFYGASNFALWTEMTEDLAGYHIQNHGFGGSTDRDLLHYAPELLYPYKPTIVVLQTGSNDYINLSGSEEQKVQTCIALKQEMFESFHEQLPDTRFVVMSGLLLPGRSQYRSLTQKVNLALSRLCDQTDYLFYVDASAMTYDGQTFADNLFVEDGIHLNRQGQLRWAQDYIQPQLESIIESFNLDCLRK